MSKIHPLEAITTIPLTYYNELLNAWMKATDAIRDTLAYFEAKRDITGELTANETMLLDELAGVLEEAKK